MHRNSCAPNLYCRASNVQYHLLMIWQAAPEWAEPCILLSHAACKTPLIPITDHRGIIASVTWTTDIHSGETTIERIGGLGETPMAFEEATGVLRKRAVWP